MAADWILARTKPGAERTAAHHIGRQLLPRKEALYLPHFYDRVHRRRRVLFDSYIFVKVVDGRGSFLRGTIGVRGLVEFGGKWAIVPKNVIKELKSRENKHGNVVLPEQVELEEGDKVLVRAGPFIGKTGLYEGMTSQSRASVLLMVLNQQTPVSIARKHLELAA